MYSKILRIAHFYPDLLNLYGDFGNVLAIKRRAEWRGLGVEIVNICKAGTRNDIKEYRDFADCDLAFIGGGQDKQQMDIAEDFLAKKTLISEAVESGMPFLAVCGGYQLLGEYYETSEGEQIEGLNILDVYTKAARRDSGEKQKRLIGNVSAELLFPLELAELISKSSALNLTYLNSDSDLYAEVLKTLVGFENHSGETFIKSNSKTKPFARIRKGFGNNASDALEGAYYKNLIGTYLHGSLLPKNPHLVDELIYQALKRKGLALDLTEWCSLDDKLELKAHEKALSL